MNRAVLVTVLAAGAVLGTAQPSRAQFQRYDYVWARNTNGAQLTLDGVLNEPQWAVADSIVIDGRQIGPIPGSGWKDEGGFAATDPNHSVIKFLLVGSQLWVGATVRDSSIGGSEIFNYFDGLLMSLKQHQLADRPAPPGEHFISWWWPSTSGDTQPRAINKPMAMTCVWRTGYQAPTPQQIQEWDARWTVDGTVNSDTLSDRGYTVEMRFDLGMNGYDVSKPGGEIVEWNVSIYDCDNYWPLSNFLRFSVNRTWNEDPWGNDAWYSNLHILCRSDVTVSSGPEPKFGPDIDIPNGQNWATPTVDGYLNESVWQYAPSFRIHWGDDAVRNAYPNTGPYRSGQFQPAVNGDTAYVQDPADCTVKYFFKGTTLYMGLDFNDQVVQYHTLMDRYDGAIITINDRSKLYSDNNELTYRLTFQVGPSGELIAHDDLPNMRDTLHAVTCDLKLKPNTTVDTLGIDVDEGYTAEFAFDLTKFGYPANLGDHALYFGVDVMDGDSYIPITDSYGTRTWFFRQYEYEDGPCVAFLDPSTYVTTAVNGPPQVSTPLQLLGNYPNPFKTSTTLHFRLPQPARLSVDVYDLQGRLVLSHALGVQSAGEGHVRVPAFASHGGLYLYRLHVADAVTGAKMGTLNGKMMILD